MFFASFSQLGYNFKSKGVYCEKRNLSLKLICNGMLRLTFKIVYPKEEKIKSPCGIFLRSHISYRATKAPIGFGVSLFTFDN